jgi:hypothetical protein
MTDKQKIADLEKRVKDLEARPVFVPIIVHPPHFDCVPIPVNPWPGYPHPYIGDWPFVPFANISASPRGDFTTFSVTCGAGSLS